MLDLLVESPLLKDLGYDEGEKHISRLVENQIFALSKPTPIENPSLIAYSTNALMLLDIEKTMLSEEMIRDIEIFFSGNNYECKTFSHVYSGYQFGVFAPQLGDGCCHSLGHYLNKRIEIWEIQLKGSGRTPFSRNLDGRKVLRSSIREFLCSELLYNLNVPTVRVATLITSNTIIIRDKEINGIPIGEQATVICRLSPSFLRFGSFEIFLEKGPSRGYINLLRKLLNYLLKNHFLHLLPMNVLESGEELEGYYVSMFTEIIKLNARLVAKWQSIGFIHGVLNTDNTSILGLTMDYGPFAFMETYTNDFTSNYTDRKGRYKYSNQKQALEWNLYRLSECWSLIVKKDFLDKAIEENYEKEFQQEYFKLMSLKLGLLSYQDGDHHLIQNLLKCMEITRSDFTDTFYALSSISSNPLDKNWKFILESCEKYKDLKGIYRQNVLFDKYYKDDVNILYDLIKEGKEDQVERMINEGIDQVNFKEWEKWILLYKNRLAKQESLDLNYSQLRIDVQRKSNPCFVFNNSIFQIVIQEAEKGNYEKLHFLTEILNDPFNPEYRHQIKEKFENMCKGVIASCIS